MENQGLTVARIFGFFALVIVAGIMIGTAMGVGRIIVDEIFGKSNESWWADTARTISNVIVALVAYGVYRTWSRKHSTEK